MVERGKECVVVDHTAAGHVDQHGIGTHGRQEVSVDEATSLFGKWARKDDDIGKGELGSEFIHRGHLVGRWIRYCSASDAHDLDAKRAGSLSDLVADRAETDDDPALATNFWPWRLFPVALTLMLDSVRNAMAVRQKGRHHILRHADVRGIGIAESNSCIDHLLKRRSVDASKGRLDPADRSKVHDGLGEYRHLASKERVDTHPRRTGRGVVNRLSVVVDDPIA